MKNLIVTVLGLSLLASGAAMAAPGNERGHGPQDRAPAHTAQPAPGKAGPAAHHAGPQAKGHPGAPGHHGAPLPPPRPGMAHGKGPSPHMAPPRGMHNAPVYRTGYRLPAHAPGVVVRDWRAQGLRQAPRGHEWRRIDGRYLLVAVATGVITDIVLHRH